MNSSWRSDSGTSMIEMAITAPIMIFLLVGLIEIGRFTYFAILAANAARAGAQYGAQDLMTAYDDAGITNAALQDGQNLSNWSVTPNQLCAPSGSPPTSCSQAWGASPPVGTVYYVQVQVTGYFPTLLNYPGIPNDIPISGSSLMRVATQ